MRSIMLFAGLPFIGFVAALPGKGIEQVLVVSTVTAEAHPLTYWALTSLDPTATPLTYGSPPKASRVPSVPHDRAAGVNLDDPDCTFTTPTSSATLTESTTLCTIVHGSYPRSTLPAFCHPSGFVNAPALASPTGAQAALPTAVVTLGANSVHDKVTCCAECANYYNCFAWRFVPSYNQTPSPRLPGGFDPWVRGNCEVAYYTGNTTEDAVTTDGAASLCPNGRLQGMLDGTSNVGRDPFSNGLYYNGWNDGACGDPGYNIFKSSSESGSPGGNALCSV